MHFRHLRMVPGATLNQQKMEIDAKCSSLFSFRQRKLKGLLQVYQEAPVKGVPWHTAVTDNVSVYWLLLFPSLYLLLTHSFSLPSTTNNCLKVLGPEVYFVLPELPENYCGWRVGACRQDKRSAVEVGKGQIRRGLSARLRGQCFVLKAADHGNFSQGST